MVSTEDILIKLRAIDQASPIMNKVKSTSSSMKVAVGAAMTAVGTATLSYAKQAVESAVTAESEWNRFGGAVNATGGDWESNSASIRKWVSNYSNSMGYAVKDTRSAMTTMMNYGLSLNETESAMKAVTGMAAAMGTTQEEASNKLIRGFAGQGRGLKTLGINLDDYKDKTTGVVDKQKLIQAIIEKTDDTVSKHADSTEAKMTRVNNALKSIKTDFGYALIDAIEPLLPLLQNFLKAINSLPDSVKSVGFVFIGLAAGVTAIAGPITSAVGLLGSLGDGFHGVINKLQGVNIASGSGLNGKLKDYADELDTEAQNVGKVDKKTREVGNKTDKLNKNTSKVNKSKKQTGLLGKIGGIVPKGTGASAMEGAVEAEAASVGFSGLSASITAMITPILVLGAVIAVIIAVVVALVSEVLIFARAIGSLIDALDFDKLNLDSSIEGIKSIGDALLELARTLGAMAIASIIGVISQGFSVLGGGIVAIKNSAEDLKKAVPILNSLASLPQINPQITTNLKNISNGIKSISNAIGNMTNASFNIWLGGFVDKITGGNLQNLMEAKHDLVGAVNILNSFKDLPTIDTTVTTNLKNLGEALTGANSALKSMTDISWTEGTGFLTGLNGAMSSLRKAHSQLVSAGKILNTFTDIPNIDSTVKEKLTGVANGLKSVKTSVDTLNKIGDINTLDIIKNTIKVKLVKDEIRKVAVHLRNLGGMAGVPSYVTTRLNLLKNALIGLNSAVNTTKNVGELPEEKVGVVQNSVNRTRTIAVSVMRLGGMAEVPSYVATRLNMLKVALNSLRSSILSINQVPLVSPNATQKVHNAVETIKSIATDLKGLSNYNIGNSKNLINSVNSAITSLSNTLRNSKNVGNSSVSLGRRIVNGVKIGMSGLTSTVSNIGNHSMGIFQNNVGNYSRNTGITATQRFANNFKLSNSVAAELTYMVNAVANNSRSFLGSISQLAINAVNNFKSGLGQNSPGLIARSTEAEMVWAAEAVTNKSTGLIHAISSTSKKVVDAWGNPTLKVNNEGLSNSVKNMTLNPSNVHDVQGNVNMNGKTGANNLVVNINDGAFQLDARNLTTQESKQILVNAIEGLDVLRNKNINGV